MTLIVGIIGGLVIAIAGWIAEDILAAQALVTNLVPIGFTTCAVVLLLLDDRCRWFWSHPLRYVGAIFGFSVAATLLFVPVCLASPLSVVIHNTASKDNASVETHLVLGAFFAGIVLLLSMAASRELIDTADEE